MVGVVADIGHEADVVLFAVAVLGRKGGLHRHDIGSVLWVLDGRLADLLRFGGVEADGVEGVFCVPRSCFLEVIPRRRGLLKDRLENFG